LTKRPRECSRRDDDRVRTLSYMPSTHTWDIARDLNADTLRANGPDDGAMSG